MSNSAARLCPREALSALLAVICLPLTARGAIRLIQEVRFPFTEEGKRQVDIRKRSEHTTPEYLWCFLESSR